MYLVPVDPEPEDTKIIREMLVDLTRKLDNAGRLEETQRLSRSC
jgi:hypothetical protein